MTGADVTIRAKIAEGRRVVALEIVAQSVKSCRRCDGMNLEEKGTQSAPGYGSAYSPVVIVGQSLCGKPCIEAQTPFTGGSGRILDRVFERADVTKSSCFITNVVHCHPPGNRASLPHEISNCSTYLDLELAAVAPRLIIALGKDAHAAIRAWATERPEWSTRNDWIDRAPDGRKFVFCVNHPRWVSMQPDRAAIIDEMAHAICWAFGKKWPAPQPQPPADALTN